MFNVIITDKVKDRIDQWHDIIISSPKYDLRRNRAEKKRNNMIKALKGLGFMPGKNSVCRFKDMGQKFNKKKVPVYKYLRQYVYKDESEVTWLFAYLIDKKNNEVLITEMKLSKHVKENQETSSLYIKLLNEVLHSWYCE